MRRYPLAIALAILAAPQVATAQAAAPLTAAAMTPFIGSYTLSDGGASTTPLRVFTADGALMGQLRTNAPSKLTFLGGTSFRPEESPEFTVQFTVAGGIAMSVVVEGPGVRMTGVRVADANAAPADPTTAGPLFDELARADSLLFDASFAHCDYAKATAFLAPDVEFYHDKTGFHEGNVVRADFRRLTSNCPAKQGIRREVVPGSLHVYPIKDFGAVQMGEHTFREAGNPSATAARFVHLWSNRNGRWVLSRVMSFDHAPTSNAAPAR